jgi:oligoendopeptidase F
MEASSTTIAPPIPRHYLPADFKLTDWTSVEPQLEELSKREITDVAALEKWLLDRSELESVLSEDMGWRYIRMTCNTQDQAATEAYQYFVSEIDPKLAPYDHALNQKLVNSPYFSQLDQEKYRIYLRSVKRALEIFREENIPLQTEISLKTQEYSATIGAMTVIIDGEEMTLPRAADRLRNPEREIREQTYRTIQARRAQDREKLDTLFNELRVLRHQVAVNAGFANFRDYMFAAMGRFDYTPADCFAFHNSIEAEVVPFMQELERDRKLKLGYDSLRPWDLDVDPTGQPPLHPFTDGKELLSKSIACLRDTNAYFSQCLETMRDTGHLDLESRKGKAPGGYNYPLDEVGVPFIFMNATSNVRDVVTLLHEGGHAVHSFLTRTLPLGAFKHPPSEVAELASMSMELLTLDHWHHYFESQADLNRAKKQHLEGVLSTFPWVATVDSFQHWIYENPDHTTEERQQKWVELFDRFNLHEVDFSGLDQFKPFGWQKQLHIFEVPFYYIEYAMAQLGAIAVWKHFSEQPAAAISQYKQALALGYTKTISEIYETAGIKFDFSQPYIKELVSFVRSELAKLHAG